MSDNEYDYSEIDYLVDRFEFYQFRKSKNHKQKLTKSPYPVSTRTLQSQRLFLKENCMGHKKTSKSNQKSFHSNRKSRKSKYFQCDKVFGKQTTCVQSKLSKNFRHNFESFRRHFYSVNRQLISSSLKDYPNVEIVNVRLASVNESIQNQFMSTLTSSHTHFPHLVYHGTKLNNIESILHYGFLIPQQAHPSNDQAPIIKVGNGQVYGTGIYCSYTATYSISYSFNTNTLLVCAAMPKCDKIGNVEHSHGSILVLPHVSQIIPLFLIDFIYLNGSVINQPFWYKNQKALQNITNEESIKPYSIIPRKYLQKISNCMNDQIRNNNRYQLRVFDPND